MPKLRKAHCLSPLVGEDNSMVFTTHSVPFPATRDLRKVTRGWKWQLVRDKKHFIFFTPVHSGPTLGKMPDGLKFFELLEEV